MRAGGEHQRPGDAEVREKHLPELLIYEPPVLKGRERDVPERKALHLAAVVVRRLERDKARPRGRYRVPELGGQLIAVARRAGAGIAQPAGADDRAAAGYAPALRFHGADALRPGLDAQRAASQNLHAEPAALARERVGDVVRPVADREDAPAPLGLERDAELLEKGHGVLTAEAVYRALEEPASAGHGLNKLAGRAVVGHVAAALAGYAQLAAQLAVGLEQHDVQAAPRRRDGAHAAGGPAAYYNRVNHLSSQRPCTPSRPARAC